MNLNESIIEKMTVLIQKEDETLWAQGDLLVEAHLGRHEMKKLADIVQRKPQTLELRRRVAIETPREKRNPNHSWSIYAIFVKIEDPATRWEMLFSRDSWTVNEARKAVREFTFGPPQPANNNIKRMVVGDVLVRGHLKDDGSMDVTVWLGNEYDATVTKASDKSTTVTFIPS